MAIKIVYYSEPIDSFGRTESSAKGDVIHYVLNDVENWTDDMTFEDETGKQYSIDELEGKEVEVPGIGIFTVPFAG